MTTPSSLQNTPISEDSSIVARTVRKPIADGVWPVMLTPFTSSGAVDWDAYDRLIDWYLSSRVHGLFAVCLSSEMLNLTTDEKLLLAKRAVKRSGGRVPVVAAGTIGESIDVIAEFSSRLADTGVDAIVCITNQFCQPGGSDEEWKRSMERFLSLVDPEISLGLYESPLPFKRLLSPELFGWVATTGRFQFHKDTCCDLETIRQKIAAVGENSLKFFNANSETLLDSLHSGAKGFSGIAANFYPQLYVWMITHFRDKPEEARQLQEFFRRAEPVLARKYPGSAKRFLGLCGATMEPVCRIASFAFDKADIDALQELRGEVLQWHEVLGLKY